MPRARQLTALAGLLVHLGAVASFAELSTVSYRESPESFTWELRWDGQLPAMVLDLYPPRPDETAPRHWAPTLRVSPPAKGGRGARLEVAAHHAARVHELDLPEGALYRAVLPLGPRLDPPGDWVRLDRRQVQHPSTPKDTVDTFDVYWKAEVSVDGARAARLLFQGAHGQAARARKATARPKKAPK